ncbi:P-loop containing nucleoside triphosphate hydrolase protein [Massariosphaeria phaeospora]|uniref:P-loop containing nucleoside triphosphate hydrolase protein n=1 Tax=Massariosphaeria phaeospora TaxID=100035 RepID=A0A7C8M5W8_9PLEO|nr:P-loop containing nucleoside triphosphate hydrolase protein [Massariosphaeria phaeospora]
MASDFAEPDSLDQLQSPEQVALLDAVDKLRSQGMGHYDISLPQLIVCGDQSSGKSSVLEGLTRLRFPMKDGTCTTFATELVLRKHATVNIACTIIPHKDRTEVEQTGLARFKETFSSREEFSFPSLIDKAYDCMAFGNKPVRTRFFKDVLQIKYSGPDLPSLTIVDLPGIIQSTLGKEKSEDAERVQELVESYMRDKKSIILAVVSAKSDPQNQKVFDYIKTHDQPAVRTLGIITKPDTLEQGSPSEDLYIQVARNQKQRLSLGWHMVMNRSFGSRETTDDRRDEAEREFFATGIWSSLSRADVGISTLRTKLSRILLDHIRRELPSLVETLQKATAATEARLHELGNPRNEAQQQRSFLMEKAQQFQVLTGDALRGTYKSAFFKSPSSDEYKDARLRTRIHNLNIAFSHVMYNGGHKWQIMDINPNLGGPRAVSSETTSGGLDGHVPIRIPRSKFLKEQVGPQVRESRQSGLPSLVNTWVIGEVFRDQSTPWEAIAQRHLDWVFDAVMSYVELALEKLVDPQTYGLLLVELIEPELERRKVLLDAKLAELLVPFQQLEPITYDPSFISDIKEIRSRRHQMIQNEQGQAIPPVESDAHLLTEFVDDFTNSEILDLVQTYYKKAISVFISNVTVLAIENCLVTDIARIFDPNLILNMEEEQLQSIASEPEYIRTERVALQQKLEDLKSGKRILDIQARRSAKGKRCS